MADNKSNTKNNNPFSESISSFLELRNQIINQQEALSEKLEQDWKNFTTRTTQRNIH